MYFLWGWAEDERGRKGWYKKYQKLKILIPTTENHHSIDPKIGKFLCWKDNTADKKWLWGLFPVCNAHQCFLSLSWVMDVGMLIFPSSSLCMKYIRHPVNTFSVILGWLVMFVDISHRKWSGLLWKTRKVYFTFKIYISSGNTENLLKGHILWSQ